MVALTGAHGGRIVDAAQGGGHGKDEAAAVLGAAQVPGRVGSPQRREEPGADRQSVRGASQFHWTVEGVVLGARGERLRAGGGRPGRGAAGRGAGAVGGQEGSRDRAFKKLLGTE